MSFSSRVVTRSGRRVHFSDSLQWVRHGEHLYYLEGKTLCNEAVARQLRPFETEDGPAEYDPVDCRRCGGLLLWKIQLLEQYLTGERDDFDGMRRRCEEARLRLGVLNA